MAYKEFDIDEIDTSVVYLSKAEVTARLGITRGTLYNHVIKDYIDAVRFHSRTFFHPDDVDRYETLVKCGFLGGAPKHSTHEATEKSR